MSWRQLRRGRANNVVSGQIKLCRGKLRYVGPNYVVSGKLRRVGATITACRGKLWRVRVNYGMSGQIMTCWPNYVVSGKLRRVGATITACRGKLWRVGVNYGVSGQQIRRAEPNKLRRFWENYDILSKKNFVVMISR